MIKTTDLSKSYGDFLALNKLNLNIKEGEIYCLLGANGAGKSTTISLLLNFIKASEGSAYINGLDVEKHPVESKNHISYIPENLMLYNKLSGVENLDFFCQLSGKKYTQDELLDFLIGAGLGSQFLHKRVESYSKGMRQKVGIALTIAKESKVLLLDEPTSGLDPKASNEFAELLSKMSERNVSILMATHDLFRARETAHNIGIMNKGVLVDQFDAKSVSSNDLEKLYINHMTQ